MFAPHRRAIDAAVRLATTTPSVYGLRADASMARHHLPHARIYCGARSA
jgi:hypothetical protein